MKHAVVVGVDGYLHAPPLRGCVNDAGDIAECLSLEQYDFDVTTLFNRDATRSNILEALGQIAYGSVSGDTLLFYFAGHGAVVGNSGHLVTHDATTFDPGLSLSHLSDIMESASHYFTNVVTILDCCHAGSAPIWTHSRVMAASDIERELRVVNSSRSILGACTADDTAKEHADPARGVFTEALVQGLLGDAVNFEGEVTLLHLHEYVSRAVDPLYQTPVFKGDLTGTVVLGKGFEPRRGAPIAVDDRRRILAKAQLLMDKHFELQNRELFEKETRIHGGSRRCAKDLEGVVRWFEDTQVSLPDLGREPDWRRLYDSMLDAQRRVSEVVQGEETAVGTLVRKIGQGGFGQVWEVKTPSGESAALKIFHGGELHDQVKAARFRNGFQNMRKLQHPNIVGVSSMTLAPLAFVMEYVPGPDLRDFYVDRSEVEPMVQLVRDIAETLVHAHHHKVRHRDIKPENIIVVQDLYGNLTPHLTDFDLAYHETNRTVTTNLGVGGVINYAAPEQLYEPNAGTSREVTVDVYSLGQLMYFIFVGTDPSGENQQRNTKELRRVLSEWTDERAAKIILELYGASTARNPKDRPASVSEVVGQLSLALGYIQAASGTNIIERANFCNRIAYLYGGLDIHDGSRFDENIAIRSKSGQIDIQLALREETGKGNSGLELRFAVERLSLTDISSSSNARNALNQRLDKVASRFPGASRRNGKHGQYEVFIDMKSVPLSVEGAATVRELISDAIGAIER
ncbi:protein kinase domain-containing protein [Arthrobacter yangruifuii]|nr:protein kinase [Arthrobacter yangruifuii]